MPSTSSDSEDCSMDDDFLKDTNEIQVNKINTSFTQKADEPEGDAVDLEHAIDEGDDQKEEGMSKKITVKMCQRGEKEMGQKTLLYLLSKASE